MKKNGGVRGVSLRILSNRRNVSVHDLDYQRFLKDVAPTVEDQLSLSPTDTIDCQDFDIEAAERLAAVQKVLATRHLI